MLAGTKDGKNWGFYFDDQKDLLQKSIYLTDEEHMALFEGQCHGEVIKFHEDRKPTLEEPEPPSEEEIAKGRMFELQTYLKNTDWYAMRKADEGKEIPTDVKKKRADVRAEISEIRKKFPTVR